MSSQLNIKRRFIDGRNDWRFEKEKAPVNTEGDQFVLGQKVFYDAIRFHNDVICDGKYQGDGSLLTNLNVNDTSKLPLAGGTMTGDIVMTNITTPTVTADLSASAINIHDASNTIFHTVNQSYSTIENNGTGCVLGWQELSFYQNASNQESFLSAVGFLITDGTESVTFNQHQVTYNPGSGSVTQPWSAILSGGPPPTLQQVLDTGNTADDQAILLSSTSTIYEAVLNNEEILLQTPSYPSGNVASLRTNSIPTLHLHADGSGSGDNREIYIVTENGSNQPQISAVRYETSTIITDDYIKIGNKSYNTAINDGDLYCDNVQCNTINGLVPTTVGLGWSAFTGANAYANLPQNNGYTVDNGAGTSSYLNNAYLNIHDNNNNQTLSATFGSIDLSNANTSYSTHLTSDYLTFQTPGNAPQISTSGNDFVLSSNGMRMLLNSGTNELYLGDMFGAGPLASLNINFGGTNILCDTKDGTFGAGDTNGAANQTAMGVFDSNKTIALSSCNLTSYAYHLPICFEKLEMNSAFSYNLAGQNWEMVRQFDIQFPNEYFLDAAVTNSRWKTDITLYLWNLSNDDDKGFALYIDYEDQNSNLYNPTMINQSFPYARHLSHSFYIVTANVQVFSWTDYVDFQSLVNTSAVPMKARLWIAADNPQYSNFNCKIGFTRTNII